MELSQERRTEKMMDVIELNLYCFIHIIATKAANND